MGLYRPSGYNWLDRLVEPIWIRSERYRSVALGARGAPDELATEHRQILEACAERDPSTAAEKLYVHLVRTANIVAEQMLGAPLFDLTPPPSLGHVTSPATVSLECA
jgi:DNA-binding GntR family transcriptional regulator